jgi:hypothetical protein
MNFDTSKKRLLGFAFAQKKKGENFFSFFSSFLCEKAESLGAVEKLSQRSTLRLTKVFLCVRNE